MSDSYSWGCQHVKQEIKWADLESLESATLKSNSDDGTKLWQPYLYDGPRPPSPVVEMPWRQPLYIQNPWHRSSHSSDHTSFCQRPYPTDRELYGQPPSTGLDGTSNDRNDGHDNCVLGEDSTENSEASGNAGDKDESNRSANPQPVRRRLDPLTHAAGLRIINWLMRQIFG